MWRAMLQNYKVHGPPSWHTLALANGIKLTDLDGPRMSAPADIQSFLSMVPGGGRS